MSVFDDRRRKHQRNERLETAVYIILMFIIAITFIGLVEELQ
jgi:hypothetical protein